MTWPRRVRHSREPSTATDDTSWPARVRISVICSTSVRRRRPPALAASGCSSGWCAIPICSFAMGLLGRSASAPPGCARRAGRRGRGTKLPRVRKFIARVVVYAVNSSSASGSLRVST